MAAPANSYWWRYCRVLTRTCFGGQQAFGAPELTGKLQTQLAATTAAEAVEAVEAVEAL